jgi:hypothetical protein
MALVAALLLIYAWCDNIAGCEWFMPCRAVLNGLSKYVIN